MKRIVVARVSLVVVPVKVRASVPTDLVEVTP